MYMMKVAYDLSRQKPYKLQKLQTTILSRLITNQSLYTFRPHPNYAVGI